MHTDKFVCIFVVGKPCLRHLHIMCKTTKLRGMIRSFPTDSTYFYKQFYRWSPLSLNFLLSCIKMDPQERLSAEDLLKHNYFYHDKFPQKFLPGLRVKIFSTITANPLLTHYRTELVNSINKLSNLDRMDFPRTLHLTEQQTPKWKMNNVVNANIKRKFNNDTIINSEINFFSLPRNSNQRFTTRMKYNEIKITQNLLEGIKKSNFYRGSYRKNFMKKKEKDEVKTTIIPLCLNGPTYKKREYVKLRNDDFSQPNVPGGK